MAAHVVMYAKRTVFDRLLPRILACCASGA